MDEDGVSSSILPSAVSQADADEGANGGHAPIQGIEQSLLHRARDAKTSVPRHVAIIMDGNGRWAKKRFLPRVAGHRAGAKSVRVIVEAARRANIRYLTLFSFSTENWFRPQGEVSALMSLFCQHLESELALLKQSNIRLRAIGDGKLPVQVRDALQRAMEETRDADGMDLVLAISYGGQQELAEAARKIALQVQAGELNPEEISPELLGQYLYAPDIPEVDLLIRTSDEFRISNFLLWQIAYAEIVVSPLLWPDFDKEEFERCLGEYARRSRRFGLTDEQVELSGTK